MKIGAVYLISGLLIYETAPSTASYMGRVVGIEMMAILSITH